MLEVFIKLNFLTSFITYLTAILKRFIYHIYNSKIHVTYLWNFVWIPSTSWFGSWVCWLWSFEKFWFQILLATVLNVSSSKFIIKQNSIQNFLINVLGQKSFDIILNNLLKHMKQILIILKCTNEYKTSTFFIYFIMKK